MNEKEPTKPMELIHLENIYKRRKYKKLDKIHITDIFIWFCCVLMQASDITSIAPTTQRNTMLCALYNLCWVGMGYEKWNSKVWNKISQKHKTNLTD